MKYNESLFSLPRKEKVLLGIFPLLNGMVEPFIAQNMENLSGQFDKDVFKM